MKSCFGRIEGIAQYSFIVMVSGIANRLIRFIPNKKLIGLFTNSDRIDLIPLNRKQNNELQRLNYRINKMSEHLPWRTKCFESALVLLLYCRIRRINMTLYFGLTKENGNVLSAHAWTGVNHVYFSGKEESGEYTPVYVRSYLPKAELS